MSITKADIKVYEPERLTDDDDGGGRATGKVIVSGAINNLYNDISRLDRTTGRVSFRKPHFGPDTLTADQMLGAHVIVTDPPQDGNVSVVLMTADSEPEERLSAQRRLEAYVVQGARATLELLGNQYVGQRQIVCIQREENDSPAVGDVYMLRSHNGADQQFVRVIDVDAQQQTFTYQTGNSFIDFTRRRVVLGISSSLDYTFPGGEAYPGGTTDRNIDGDRRARVFTTEVADAAQYYGVAKAKVVGEIGDVSIEVDSIYTQLVPSAQAEQPLIDYPLGQGAVTIRKAGSATAALPLRMTVTSSTEAVGYLPRAAVPGSVQLHLLEPGHLDYQVEMRASDNGLGELIVTWVRDLAPRVLVAVGDALPINYETGEIRLTATKDIINITGEYLRSSTAKFIPAASYSGRKITDAIAVTLNNRSYSYARSFPAEKPRPGSMVVSYMVMGKWYEIRDTGTGQMEGAGAGSVNFTTGSVLATLEGLPDVGSSILFSFLVDIEGEVELHDGPAVNAKPEIVVQIEPGLKPSTIAIAYTSGGVAKTATDDGNFGITGDAEGTVNYSTGELNIKLAAVPDSGTTVDVDFQSATTGTATIQPTPTAGGMISGTIPNAPLEPGSINFRALLGRQSDVKRWEDVKFTFQADVRDDGAGGWIMTGSMRAHGAIGNNIAGSINYTTGEYTLELLPFFPVKRYYWGGSVSSATDYPRLTLDDPDVVITYQSASPGFAPGAQVNYDTTHLYIQLIDGEDNPLIPGSVLFTFAGKTYYDRDGIIYTDFAPATGAGTAVGSINYGTYRVTLDSWPSGASGNATILGALTAAGNTFVSEITFRTPSAPLRPQSLQVTVTDIDGNIITATADVDGSLTATGLVGSVDVQTGLVKLTFTDGSSPVYVLPDGGRYNAVMYSYLPMDAEIIGVDPVRLPSDGRVPIFRPGDVIVLSHTDTTAVGTPTDGQVVTLGRDHQESIIVVDSAGTEMAAAQYTADTDAGTVTFASPVSLVDEAAGALVPPLSILDRIEHMTLCNDVHLSGKVNFITPLAHSFPANESTVSSALLFGDLEVRAKNYFTQKTWNSGSPNWTSARIGDDTTANYNIVDNPIEIANTGCVSEKWALIFTSSTGGNIVGETLGIIGTFSTGVDLAPENPNTTTPYFVMREAGFGTGWSQGNVIRFNTESSKGTYWTMRTIMSGPGTVEDDEFVLQHRGDAG